MSDDVREDRDARTQPDDPAAQGQTDHARRRLTTAGLAGAGVLMTLPGRSALGAGIGQCGSETASAALSRHGEPAMCGCSPGFWWRSPHGLVKWTEYIPQYGPSASFNQVFFGAKGGKKATVFFRPGKDRSLGSLGPGAGSIPVSDTFLTGQCGPLHAIVFHAVAALLNATYYGSRYPSMHNAPHLVISAFQTAFANDLVVGGCSNLTRFKEEVDVYDQGGGLWCFNGISRNSDDWTQQY